jgi:3-dehydroquinate dehydratase-2
MTKILVIQGANLVHLGKREPQFYGTALPEEYDRTIRGQAAKHSCECEIFYTNIEGEAINKIYAAEAAGVDGLLMNPAGFSHAGYALRDCIKGVQLPYVEVHISHVERRGIKSVVAEAAEGVIFGFGIHGYVLGVDALLHIIGSKT